MLRLFYASLKYFALGLVVGLLTAPRPGRESRRLLQDQIGDVTKDWFSGTGGRSGTTTSTGMTGGTSPTGRTGTTGRTGPTEMTNR